MEPMTLGSPVGSPSTQNPTSPFLPGFLMGDPMPQPTSPSKTPRQVHFTPNLSSTIPNTPTSPPGASSLNENFSRFHKNQREKSGGAPTIGLSDTLEINTSPVVNSPHLTPFDKSGREFPHTSLQQTITTPNQNLICQEESARWVTVFGFPPSAASSILGQFSQVGHIIEHRFPGQGNWVNICYASHLDAMRALKHNGKVLAGNTMIGVIRCRDPIKFSSIYSRTISSGPKLFSGKGSCKYFAVKSQQSENALYDMTNMLNSTVTPTTPKSPQLSRLPRRFVTSPTSPYAHSPRGGHPHSTAAETGPQSQNTPIKNTSFVTRAVDYVFGW